MVTTLTSNGAKVGYILFNDHIATSESELITAFTSLQQQGVSDLVLDIRYNGGGLLDIASEVAFMIAGSAQTSGHTFELQQFNSQYPTTNPVDRRHHHTDAVSFDLAGIFGRPPARRCRH